MRTRRAEHTGDCSSFTFAGQPRGQKSPPDHIHPFPPRCVLCSRPGRALLGRQRCPGGGGRAWTRRSVDHGRAVLAVAAMHTSMVPACCVAGCSAATRLAVALVLESQAGGEVCHHLRGAGSWARWLGTLHLLGAAEILRGHENDVSSFLAEPHSGQTSCREEPNALHATACRPAVLASKLAEGQESSRLVVQLRHDRSVGRGSSRACSANTAAVPASSAARRCPRSMYPLTSCGGPAGRAATPCLAAESPQACKA